MLPHTASYMISYSHGKTGRLLHATFPIRSYTQNHFGKLPCCGYPFITLRMVSREEKQAQFIHSGSSHIEAFKSAELNTI